MSFSAISSIATSAMTASQLRMQVASSNIANADTTGYTKKSANQTATVTSGVGTGTAVTSITSTVDKYLLKDLTAAATELGAATTTDDYATNLGSLFGSVSSTNGDSTSLADLIASLQSAISSLSATPESSTLAAQATSSFDAVASQIRQSSNDVQTLRDNASYEIADDVASANEALNTIGNLNDEIVAAKAQNQSTADLEDQRNEALQTLAGLMDVNYYINSNGQMQVSTTGGTMLVDSSVHELSYASTSTAAANTVFDPVTVDGKDITAEIASGNIGALIQQRDVTLPAVQDELDSLASTFSDTVNAVYNTMTSNPPPSTLSGTTAVSSSDAFSGSGTVRIAVTDSSGDLVNYQDLDLSQYSTVGDLVNALNSVSGISASVASGKLVLSSTDSSDGIAIGGTDDAAGSSGQGFSDYFGLNDLLVGSSGADIAVRSDILGSADSFATSTLDMTTSPTVGSSILSTSGDAIDQLYGALTGSASFAAAGSLSARSSTLTDYASAILSGISGASSSADSTLSTKQTAYNTLSDSFSSETGVNLDEETANLTALQQEYSASAQILSVLKTMFEALLQSAQS